MIKNVRHEAFAKAYALRGNASAAYRDAGYTGQNADVLGPALLGRPDISARVAELRAEAHELGGRGVLTILEKRLFLARVVRAKLAELPDDSDLWQEITTSEGGVKKKLPDKLAAIRLDNDLAGDGAEATAQLSFVEALRHIMHGENYAPSAGSSV